MTDPIDKNAKGTEERPTSVNVHRRRSLRLSGYDYSSAGAYFVTICTQNREYLFGEMNDDEMRLNDAGKMIEKIWQDIPLFYQNIDIDEHQIMPNHFHGIVRVGAGPRACPEDVGWQSQHSGPSACSGNDGYQPQHTGQPRGVAPTDTAHTGIAHTDAAQTDTAHADATPTGTTHSGVAPTGAGLSLPDVVHRFKTMTTKLYIDGVRQWGWKTFPGKLWQRNYYEHVIRGEEDMHRIRQYIVENTVRWTMDENFRG